MPSRKCRKRIRVMIMGFILCTITSAQASGGLHLGAFGGIHHLNFNDYTSNFPIAGMRLSGGPIGAIFQVGFDVVWMFKKTVQSQKFQNIQVVPWVGAMFSTESMFYPYLRGGVSLNMTSTCGLASCYPKETVGFQGTGGFELKFNGSQATSGWAFFAEGGFSMFNGGSGNFWRGEDNIWVRDFFGQGGLLYTF